MWPFKKRKPLTYELLVKAKKEAMHAEAVYKNADNAFWSNFTSTDAKELVSLKIAWHIARNEMYIMGRRYENLWTQYIKEQGL